METTLKVKNVTELLLEFSNKNLQSYYSKRLNFKGVNENDVYNITAPFKYGQDTLIVGRVEKRDSENSEAVFFKSVGNNIWVKKDDMPILKLQDPFITKVSNEFILGGVEIRYKQDDKNSILYKTVFYKGNNLNRLQRFAEGPELMKDIRFIQLNGGKILVFTRPKNEFDGANIGYLILNSLDELNAENILKAKLLKNQFIKDEWGGVNGIYKLSNGLIGVLGHIAKFDKDGNRHYYSTSFAFNVATGETSPMKIIATRKNFEDGDYKRKDLVDVIFSGGIVRRDDGKAELYCGVSDAEAHEIEIDDPFIQYEK